jgi:hypothetical protein
MEPSAYAMRHLKPLPTGHLAAHPNFRHLTPSQKRPISERIGVGLAKFHSERTLGVPRLHDVEGLRGAHAVSVAYVNSGAVRRQPDLIGEAAPNKWHIVEAKGRSSKSSVAEAVRDGKLQVQNIHTFNGFVPETRTVSACYIADDGITSTLQDHQVNGSVPSSSRRSSRSASTTPTSLNWHRAKDGKTASTDAAWSSRALLVQVWGNDGGPVGDRRGGGDRHTRDERQLLIGSGATGRRDHLRLATSGRCSSLGRRPCRRDSASLLRQCRLRR